MKQKVNFFKRLLIKIIFLKITAFAVYSQQTITGKISDAKTGEPLTGATVNIKGTSKGVISDIDGNYSINVGKNDSILMYSFVGYATEQISIANRSTINVQMLPDQYELNEIVVIGYGTQKKDDVTGAVSVVDSEDIQRNKPSTFTQALQGIAAGVSVSNTSGQPGSKANIRIRGIGSISSGTDPLFVIDGVITDNPYVVNNINPADIESVSVLKDASSAAIYGARGANGVIVITTKQAKQGKTTFNFSAYKGYSVIPKKYDILNADEYANFSQAAWETSKENNPRLKLNKFYTDSARKASGAADNNWLDLITQTSEKQNYNLSISSGSEEANILFSANYYTEKGVLIETGYERFSGRLNSNINVTDWLTIGESFNYNRGLYELTSHVGENPWKNAIRSSPFMNIYNPDNIGGYAGPDENITGPNDKSNPFAEQKLNDNQQQTDQLIGSAYMLFKPIKGLTYKMNLNLNLRHTYDYKFSPEYELARAWNNASTTLTEKYFKSTMYGIDNTLTYKNSFANNNVSILIGHSVEYINSRDLITRGKDLAYDDKPVMRLAKSISFSSGGEYDFRSLSYFGRLLYDYKNKYFLTATLRRDANDKFAPSNRVGYFPSFSLGWKLNEDLLTNINQIELIKIRLGWGQTGNSNFAAKKYVDLINTPLESRYPFGLDEEVHYAGTILRSFANPSIQWEASEMTNIGTDINLFRNKVQFTGEYYYKKQEQMIIELEQYHFFGRQQESATQPVNAGNMVNKGFEFNLVYKKLEGAFNYTIGGNLTTISNEVLELPEGRPLLTEYTITEEGSAVGSFYGFVADGILQVSDFDEYGYTKHAPKYRKAQPGDIKFLDLNGDSLINDDDRTIIGSPIPKIIYGLNFDFSYKNFDLSLLLQGTYGNEIYNSLESEVGLATEPNSKSWNRLEKVKNFWTEENPVNNQTRASITDENDNNRMSSWFVEDGSYLRLKNLQIGYTLPATLTKNTNIRFYLSGSNLLTFTKYSGLDPELKTNDVQYSGFDNGSYPVPRSFIGGIEINF